MLFAPWATNKHCLIKKLLFSHVNNVVLEVLNFSKTTMSRDIFKIFSAIKTDQY